MKIFFVCPVCGGGFSTKVKYHEGPGTVWCSGSGPNSMHKQTAMEYCGRWPEGVDVMHKRQDELKGKR